ncbi:MAG TPA: hypothetical protein VIK84_03215 [Haloplasmataceae bacterium]
MKDTKTYLDHLQELEDMKEEDRKIFYKLKQAKEVHCDRFNKYCLFVSLHKEQCYKDCQYYQDTIQPLEDKSLQLLVAIENKKKEIKEKYGELD